MKRLALPSLWLCLSLQLWWTAAQAQITTNLADFGFNIHGVNGEPATNTRPLLIILTTNRTGFSIPATHDKAYFSNLLFKSTSTQSVMGFFRENSNNRFHWTNAGVVGPINLSTNDLLSVRGDDFYYSNIIARVVTGGLFNFKPRDLNNDGTVTGDELQLVVIMDEDRTSGGARGTEFVISSNIPNGSVNISMRCLPTCPMLFMNYETSFGAIAHELVHTLGPQEDLYNQQDQGTLNHFATIMSDVSREADNSDTRHLDPWNKMRLGWSEPRIMPLNTGGVATLPAAYRQITNAPVILYDTNHGPTRFFLIEYRKRSSYDRDVLSDGLAIWHVMQHPNHTAWQVPSAGARFATETGWLPCDKCGYFVSGAGVANSCPADDAPHAPGGGPYYLESDGAAVPGEREWRRCRKCEGLFYGPNEVTSICPRDGFTHLPPTINNPNYSLRTNDVRGALPDWFRCFKCQGLFNMGVETNSPFKGTTTCPAGGNHSKTNISGVMSREYFMVAYDWGMFAIFPPDLTREPSQRLWTSDEVTPVLSWADETFTKSYLYIRPFAPGADEITVEIRSAEDTWVDFSFDDSPRNGSFDRPYRTLAEGVGNAAWGGVLNFKPGSSPETGLITKPLTFVAPLPGTVTIGE
jgi:M6 family metalloprotease-like protein